ncbi:MAG: universal stress protein [Bacteroidia bacterium]|nr:universal stress protein [Bacteroidia bacterium]
MNTFKINKILVPVDLSANSLLALEHATFMAKLFKADIILAHVMETMVAKLDLGSFTTSDKKRAENTIVEKLENLCNELRVKSGVKVSYVLKTGKIAKAIKQISDENKIDIIIMGTHGVSGFQEFFLGSNAFRVVTVSQVPVITVQTNVSKVGFDNILCPIDNSDPSREKVRYILELAKKYNSKVHILGILSVDDDDAAVALDKKLEQVENYFAKHDVNYTMKMVEGDNLAMVTMKYAKKMKSDLIVIMTEQEDNIAGIFLGPFAQQIVNRSKIPVMSITPDPAVFSSKTSLNG